MNGLLSRRSKLGGAVAVPFAPTDITGLKVWLAPESLSGLADDDPVATWTDSSGTGNDLTASGTARPTYKINIQNGKPVVRFNGTTNYLRRAALVANVVQPNTCYIACIYRGVVPVTGTMYVVDGGALNQQRLVIIGSTWSSYAGGGALVSDGAADNSAHVLMAIFNGATCVVARDGVSGAAADGGSATLTGFTVGAAGSATSGFSQVDVGEVLEYAGLHSAGEQASVRGYLKDRWGTP